MLDFLKKNSKKDPKYATHTADGKASCPKCGSTSLHVEHIEGTGVKSMGPASIGYTASPAASLFGGGPMPVPPTDMSAENIHDGEVKFTCNNCGHQFLLGKK